MTPDFAITIDGGDVTSAIEDRLIKLTVTDMKGTESDTVEIELEDREPYISMPRRGAEMEVSLGYLETGLTKMGTYTVDEVKKRFDGESAGKTMIISGSAADMRKSLKQQKTRPWEKKTVGEIVEKIAKEHKLTPAVSEKFKKLKLPFKAQTEESDMHFLTRVARELGAVSTPKQGRLVFAEAGTGKSASGKDMPKIRLTEGDFLDWEAVFKDRPHHGKVVATTFDTGKTERKAVESEGGDDDAPIFELRHPYPTEEEAKAAAGAKQRELQREEGSFTGTISGDPKVRAESPLDLVNVDRDVDGLPWTSERAEHTLDEGGYKTKIEAKLPGGDKSDSAKGKKKAKGKTNSKTEKEDAKDGNTKPNNDAGSGGGASAGGIFG